MESCDLPRDRLQSGSAGLNPKGFWRIDKEKPPELRQTVLTLIAFHELMTKGLNTFLSQNAGEGWLIPEAVRLADFGLGHDDRADAPQPVAPLLGPRFLDWQLDEEVARSWEECAAHKQLSREIIRSLQAGVDANGSSVVAEEEPAGERQEGLF